MPFTKLTKDFAVSTQVTELDIIEAAEAGFTAVINARPDGEDPGQPSGTQIAALAQKYGLAFTHVPITTSAITDNDIATFAAALYSANGPVLGYCRSGTRAAMLWSLAQVGHMQAAAIFDIVAAAGLDISSVKPKILSLSHARSDGEAAGTKTYDVVIVGGGSAGIATAASLLKRRGTLTIAIIEPSDVHYYQPGWTLVGAGVFTQEVTRRPTAQVMPDKVTWVHHAVTGFAPDMNEVILADGSSVRYRVLVAAPGLKLNWNAIPGLSDALGRNGVTSNYRYDLAPYTHRLVSNLKSGRALFTQPPMPIKCAGAPQKAMYLSCDIMREKGTLANVEVEFHNAGAVLFGVAAYVPALMSYIQKYNIDLNFESKLTAVDGAARIASFTRKGLDGQLETIHREFDILHAVPPQVAPDFIAASTLAGSGGFIEVDAGTLQHPRFHNIFSLGDAAATSNAKTAAAVRAQAPTVAINVLATLDGQSPSVTYDGYGSCPLTVERGKIVLAEFGYGGKLMPSFPAWVIDGTKPSRAAWFLKDRVLPFVYWQGMLKGREWMIDPAKLEQAA